MTLAELRTLRTDRHSAHLFDPRCYVFTIGDLVELIREREIRRCPGCDRLLDRSHFVLYDSRWDVDVYFDQCEDCEAASH